MSSSDAAYLLAKQRNKNLLSKQQGALTSPVNRLEQVAEALQYWKQRFTSTTPLDQEKIIEKLIHLRAEQTILLIQEVQEQTPVLADQKTSRIMAAYYADCAKLLTLTPQNHNGHN